MESNQKLTTEKTLVINMMTNAGDLEWSLSIPHNETTNSLLLAFQEIQSFEALPDPCKEAHRDHLKRFQAASLYELIWVLKHQLKLWQRSDPPFNSRKAQAYEPSGRVLIAKLNLCEACLDYIPDISARSIGVADFAKMATKILPGESAILHLWRLVCLESKLSALMELGNQETQKQYNKNETKFIQKLSNWENPYRSDDPFRIHSYNLINAAITIGKYQAGDGRELMKVRKEFQNRVWTPYLIALRQRQIAIRDGVGDVLFRSFEVKGDALICKIGGRQRKTVFAPPKKNLSNRGRKRK